MKCRESGKVVLGALRRKGGESALVARFSKSFSKKRCIAAFCEELLLNNVTSALGSLVHQTKDAKYNFSRFAALVCRDLMISVGM